MPGPDPDASGSDSGWRDKAKKIGKSLRDTGADESRDAASISSSIRPVAYKRGGKVRKKKSRGKGRRKSR